MADAVADTVLIEGIIFDLDGTLIDYEGASHTALSRPLERRGKALTWEIHAAIVGTKPEDWSVNVLRAVGLGADELLPSAYAAEYFDEVKELYKDIEAWPGTLPLLRRLKARGFPMAIATSSPRASFDAKMAFHPEILALMDAAVCGDDVARGKPSPDIFLEAARRLRCDPAACVVFEDSPLGVEGAHAAGSLAVALPDARFRETGNAERFAALAPRWVLPGGIGDFDCEAIALAPVSAVDGTLPGPFAARPEVP